MDRQERGRILIGLAQWMADVRVELDALGTGDSSGIPQAIKRDVAQIEYRMRLYARILYLGACPSSLDVPPGSRPQQTPGGTPYGE